MKSWINLAVKLALIGAVLYGAFHYYRAGYLSRPEMPEGAHSVSFKNGLRAILVDTPNERTTRRYFGHRFQVPFYLEDVWSFCAAPTDDETKELARIYELRAGERYKAVCKIEIENEIVPRGFITSVPRL